MGRLIYIPAPGGIPYTYTKSLDLDGSNEYVDFGDQSAMDGDSPFSLFCVVKFDVSGNTPRILSKNTGGVANSGWAFIKDILDRPRFIIWDSSGNRLNVFCSETLSTGVWYRLGVSTDALNAGSTTIYINGTAGTMNTSFDEKPVAANIPNTQPVRAGAQGAGDYLNGKLFAAGFYSGSLSGANHAAIAALSPLNLEAGPGTLIFYPRFGNDPDDDATSGTGVIKDRVGGFDGTPMNTESGDIVTDAP